MNGNRALLAKINFPVSDLILTGIFQTMFNAAIKIRILLLVLLFVGVHPGWGAPLIPAGVPALVLTGIALGLAIIPLGVLYGDIGRGIQLIIQLLMYLSPVELPLATTCWPATLMRLNPLTPPILNARGWWCGWRCRSCSRDECLRQREQPVLPQPQAQPVSSKQPSMLSWPLKRGDQTSLNRFEPSFGQPELQWVELTAAVVGAPFMSCRRLRLWWSVAMPTFVVVLVCSTG